MTTAAQRLASLPAGEVSLERAVVLDWHDGPLEGFLRISGINATWYFQVVAERTRSDQPDDRLYMLFQAPIDAVDRLTEALGEDETTTTQLYVPSWRFRDSEARRRADALLAELLDRVELPQVVLRSTDLLHVEEVWLVTRNARINR